MGVGGSENSHVELVGTDAIILDCNLTVSSRVGNSQTVTVLSVYPREISHMTSGRTDKAAYYSNVFNKKKSGGKADWPSNGNG